MKCMLSSICCQSMNGLLSEPVFVSMESSKGARRDFKHDSLKGKVHETISCKTVIGGLWHHMKRTK